jgi:hypothetical protein
LPGVVFSPSTIVLAFLTALLTFTPSPASADPSPAPSPTPTPLLENFTWNGSIRAFYFARTNGNTCLTSACSPKGTPNSEAFNSGLKLHGEYALAKSPWSLGATYFGAEPFAANASGVLGVGYNPEVDNTLPGYGINTFGEMYVQYKTPGVFFQTGKEIINTPWANDADSRIVPMTFQGTLITANLSPAVKVGVMYMARFKSRVTSAFNANTLLTSCNTANPTGKGPIAGVPGTFTVEGDPCYTQQTTSGLLLSSASYSANGLAANVYQYHIYDLVNLTYADAKYEYDRKSLLNPYVGAQYFAVNDTGRALVGTVHNHGYGLEIGGNLDRNIQVNVSYNDVPFVSYIVSSKRCSGNAASPTKPGADNIFGGVVNDSVTTGLPSGQVLCYGGGIASPYTDNYETDPLYTTSIGQGLGDTHKAGVGYKFGVTIESNNHRLKAILAQARYNDSLPGTSAGLSNADIRTETNVDVQYFFSAVDPKRPYHGLSLRERLVDRVETFTPFDFKYNRTQLEFDF